MEANERYTRNKTSNTTTKHVRDYVYDVSVPALGNGTYGVVHRGLDLHGHPVAIKKVSLYGGSGDRNENGEIEHGVSCELLREFSFLQTLRTQTSTAVLFPTDMFIEDGTVVMIYPLMEETLFHYMTRTRSHVRRQNIALFQTIVDQLICALHFCARHNIRHNDVHASNVLVTIPNDTSKTRPEIKLTDLGLCTYEPSLPWLAWSNLYEWSYYQAPELAKCILQEPIHKSFLVDSRVDVWSLGVIIIEYGAPQSIKDAVKDKLYPRYKYDPSAHPTNRNDKPTIRLSMQGSTEYYHQVMIEWKEQMFQTEIKSNIKFGHFYTRLFMLLKNIFTDYKMRWNIRTCYEYWVEHRTKLVIHDYSLHDRTWLSKFAHILTRFQHDPIGLMFLVGSGDKGREIPVWSDLVQFWYDESKNIVYVLECFRLLYDYLLLLLMDRHSTTRKPTLIQGHCLVYHNNTLKLTIPDHEWDELNQAIFGLVHKLLHNVPRSDFAVNVAAERRFLDVVEFNIWSSWIQAPISSSSLISFSPKHVKKDLLLIQHIVK